jgi:hypothetical protein
MISITTATCFMNPGRFDENPQAFIRASVGNIWLFVIFFEKLKA